MLQFGTLVVSAFAALSPPVGAGEFTEAPNPIYWHYECVAEGFFDWTPERMRCLARCDGREYRATSGWLTADRFDPEECEFLAMVECARLGKEYQNWCLGTLVMDEGDVPLPP